MEVETVSCGYVPTPLKELSPRRIGYALAKVFVLNHIRNAEVFSNKNVVFFVMIEFVNYFSNKVFAFVCRPFLVQSRHKHGFIPTFRAFFTACHRLIVFVE